MKKIILIAVLLVVSVTAFGQNKWQQKQINYFVDAATTEYSLDNKQVKELTKARVEMVNEYSEIGKEVKAGTLSDEDKKVRGQETSKKFQKVMSKLTGESYQELKPFYERMREELKNLK